MRFIILLLMFSSLLFAVMPPSYYKKMIEESQIKAEALVLHVKITDKTEYKIQKEITFKLIKSDGKVKPKEQFKGWCYSATDKPLVGGEIYYYPKVGEKVYVTLSTKGGKVTSLKTLINTEQELMNAIATIATKSEKEGLKQLESLIKKNPREFKNSYHKLFLEPNKSKYTSVLKQGYNRFVDLMVFKELAKQTGVIDKYMQDSAITYIFFSSSKNFANKHLPFMELFRELMQKNLKNNTKENQELLALFVANYLLSRGREGYAYRTLEKNAPYHEKALKSLNYFSSLKNLPIFKDRDKIVKITGAKLKEPMFEHNP